MKNFNINIEVKVCDVKEIKEVLKEVKSALEKEYNCTCTLNISVAN